MATPSLSVDALLLQAAFDAAPIGLAIIDPDLRFVLVNEQLARMNGMSAEEHRGRSLPDLLPDVSPDVFAAMRRVIETGEAVADIEVSGETAAQRGTRRSWLESYRPIVAPSGTIVGLVATVVDVTEQRQAEAARDAFLDVLSHEMRTPITTIFGGGQVLAGGLRDPDLVREVAAEIADEAARLNRLVENLLVLSRVERGASLARDEPVLLQHVVERVVRQERARNPSIRFEVAVSPGLPPVAADEGYVEQILGNLISNAVKYGEPGGTVTVSVRRSSDTLVLAVADEGPGFVDRDEDRVFDLFYRGQVAAGRAIGAGIGLFVVRALAEAVGGRVSARTRAEGGGEVSAALPIVRT
ncbi:MAG TPA: PAS domain-containing protein [Candidatus Limnocylindrales bacterium]|nr:PAS domain-containing protein [Candidatus Limnocylindrales bacterium]